MDEIVVSVEKLSKQYRLGQIGRKSLYDDVNSFFLKAFLKQDAQSVNLNLTSSTKNNYIWALKDVGFEIKRGEATGIIGKNGAGKSTLLKLLSKVTAPTIGKIKVKGKIASLLEVGTGFHPELSGRDNIFLNGAILGMNRREIKKKFDEIVEFSGVNRYIDTPVKRYSSGMYVRLAFAVAAHLEPDILIVDEVLAVGDAEFQKKCLGKMKDVSDQSGRTVLFVSHNMDAISRLCKDCLYLKNGELVNVGSTNKIVSEYLQSESSIESQFYYPNDALPGTDIIKLVSTRIIDLNSNTKNNFLLDEKIGVEIIFKVLQETNDFVCGFNLYNFRDVHLFTSHDISNISKRLGPGIYKAVVWMPQQLLAHGFHYCGVAGISYSPFVIHFNEINKVSFNITDVKKNDLVREFYSGQLPGVVRPVLQWEDLTRLE